MKGVQLWLVPDPLLPTATLAEHAEAVLSEDELQRCRSHRLPKGQRAFLLTRLALRALLSYNYPDTDPADWRFSRSESGKPLVSFPKPKVSFNLSHAGSMVALAFSEQVSIGVDIEHCDRELDAEALAARYFSAREYAMLMSLPVPTRRQRFLTLWTMKEAVVKASGLGLARALKDYEFVIDDDSEELEFRQLRVPEAEQDRTHWEVFAGQSGSYHLALAAGDVKDQTSLTSDLVVRQFTWPGQVQCCELSCLYKARLTA